MAKKRKIYSLNQEAVKYCFDKGYKIYPITNDNVTYRIEMTLGNQKATLTDVYNQKDIHQAIADVYQKCYDKRKDK